MSDMSLLRELVGAVAAPLPFGGVAVGIVTNNQDPDKLGRVKVKLPWLSDQDESAWARVATPMAGPQRGLYLLPEVNDEVLVAFAQGDLSHPYVLGALWNGQDKPPESNEDGKNQRRSLTSRSGHVIRLDDSDNAAQIEIIAAGAKSSIIINAQENTIEIKADADIKIEASKGKLTLQGQGIAITSQAEIKIEAKQNLDLQAGPQLNVKGQMVNIN